MHIRFLFRSVSFLILFLFSAAAVQPVSGRSKSEKLDIYICIGQSNMAGRAAFSKDMDQSLENIYLFNSENKFEKAANPLNKYSTIRKGLSMQGLNPAYSFSKEMAKRSGKKIGLVVNARGGSPIKAWLKGAPNKYYDKILARAKAAAEYGRIKGIIWHQGESDIRNEGMPDLYREQLTRLVNDLRRDLGIKDLPFVAGQIGTWVRPAENTVAFNKMIREVSSFLPHASCVSAEGLPTRGDNLHFGTEGQLQLGERYAEKMLELQGIKIKEKKKNRN